MSQDEENERSAGPLPPPAFPPGQRRLNLARDLEGSGSELGGALISPDEPLPPRSKVPEEAFISPDEPIVAAAGRRHADRLDQGGGVATGIGDDPHVERGDLVAAGDPYVADLVEKVAKLAEALRARGEAGLRTGPGMSRFEATLRAYCVGYLAGRRADDEGT